MEELFFDSKIIVVNKPAGILSQPDGKGTLCVPDSYRKNPTQKFPVCAHRLDRNTSGCQVLARNPKSAKRLHEAFIKGNIEKSYLIVTRGKTPDKGTIEEPLRKFQSKSFVDKRGKPAKTKFQILSRSGDLALLEVEIETGRFHQIRAHFAHKRNPLLGDRKYGQGPSTRMYSRPAIHAWKLILKKYNPDNSDLKLEAGLPKDFQDLLDKHKLKLP